MHSTRSVLACALLLATIAGNAQADHVFASGGQVAQNASLRLWSTVGEVAAADPFPRVLGGPTSHGVGFWYLTGPTVVAVDPLPPATQLNWLGQNHPNPFNPSTNIHFSVAEAGPVRLRLFNLRGELVADLVDQPLAAGEHTLVFRPTDLSSGVYVYRLETAGFASSRRLLLLK